MLTSRPGCVVRSSRRPPPTSALITYLFMPCAKKTGTTPSRTHRKETTLQFIKCANRTAGVLQCAHHYHQHSRRRLHEVVFAASSSNNGSGGECQRMRAAQRQYGSVRGAKRRHVLRISSRLSRSAQQMLVRVQSVCA